MTPSRSTDTGPHAAFTASPGVRDANTLVSQRAWRGWTREGMPSDAHASEPHVKRSTRPRPEELASRLSWVPGPDHCAVSPELRNRQKCIYKGEGPSTLRRGAFGFTVGTTALLLLNQETRKCRGLALTPSQEHPPKVAWPSWTREPSTSKFLNNCVEQNCEELSF